MKIEISLTRWGRAKTYLVYVSHCSKSWFHSKKSQNLNSLVWDNLDQKTLLFKMLIFKATKKGDPTLWFLKVGQGHMTTIAKRWSHIIIPMNVGLYCESYEYSPMFLFLKVGTTLLFLNGSPVFTINKKEALHYNSYKGGRTL